MALSASVLEALIISELQSQGFITTGTHAFAQKMAAAVAAAVVTHITTSAVVTTLLGAPDGEHTGIVT